MKKTGQEKFVLYAGIICFSQHDKDENANLCSSSSWLDKLNKPNKYNRLKPPQARENHRKNNGNGVGGVDDGGSSSTLGKIVEKLKKFGYVGDGDGEGKEKRE